MSTLVHSLSGWLGRHTGRHAEEESHATTKTGGTGDLEPVVVWEAANCMEAQIVRGRLVTEGIPATLRGEALGRIYGLTSGKLASTDVLVPAPLAEKSRRILDTDVEWVLEDEADDASFSSEEQS